jgi:hypothetical protein
MLMQADLSYALHVVGDQHSALIALRYDLALNWSMDHFVHLILRVTHPTLTHHW